MSGTSMCRLLGLCVIATWTAAAAAQPADAKVRAVEKEVRELTEKLKATEETLATTRRALEGAQKRLDDARGSSSTPAKGKTRFIVAVPTCEARLYVNDKLYYPSGSKVREFNSTPIERDKRYSYTLRVEYDQNGKPKTETKEVTFTTGTEQRVTFGPAAKDE